MLRLDHITNFVLECNKGVLPLNIIEFKKDDKNKIRNKIRS